MYSTPRNTKVMLGLAILAGLAPALAFAAGLVPCGNAGEAACTTCDFWVLLQRVINFFVEVAFPIGAIGIVVGGFFIMTAGGSESRVTQGREILTTAVVGIIITLVAWVVLNSLFQFLATGYPQLKFWNQIQCTSAPISTDTGGTRTTPPTPGNLPPPSVETGTLGEQDARSQLQQAGVQVNKGACPSGSSFQQVPGGCTTLQGIKPSTIQGVIAFKNDCNCSVVVTGGTEAGHTSSGADSHAGGTKVDIQRNPQLDGFIQSNYQFAGTRSDGSSLYKSPSGAIFAKEGTHWDVKGWEASFPAK